jgi:hypothetical protein
MQFWLATWHAAGDIHADEHAILACNMHAAYVLAYTRLQSQEKLGPNSRITISFPVLYSPTASFLFYIYKHIGTYYTYTSTCTCIYRYMYVHMYMLMQVPLHMSYMHMHMHMYMPVCAHNNSTICGIQLVACLLFTVLYTRYQMNSPCLRKCWIPSTATCSGPCSALQQKRIFSCCISCCHADFLCHAVFFVVTTPGGVLEFLDCGLELPTNWLQFVTGHTQSKCALQHF